MELAAAASVSPKFSQNLLSLSDRLKQTLYDKSGHESISLHSNWYFQTYFLAFVELLTLMVTLIMGCFKYGHKQICPVFNWGFRSRIESVINICEWHALAIDCRAEARSESNSQSIHQRNPIATDSLANPVPDGRSQFCRFKIWRHIKKLRNPKYGHIQKFRILTASESIVNLWQIIFTFQKGKLSCNIEQDEKLNTQGKGMFNKLASFKLR